jgi:hypothetical protein
VVVECAIEAWRQTRLAWCEAHGYSPLDLLRAEVQAKKLDRGLIAMLLKFPKVAFIDLEARFLQRVS